MKAFTFEGHPFLLQDVTKISTVYPFFIKVALQPIAAGNSKDETELALGTKRFKWTMFVNFSFQIAPKEKIAQCKIG